MIYVFYHWQALIGAMVGAAAPVAFWFFIEWRKRVKRRKENLYYIEKALVLNINMVGEAHRTVSRFIELKLNILIQHINEDIKAGRYSLNLAFLPLFNCKPADNNIFRLNTGSGHLDNKLMQIYIMSRDFAESINDLRSQFYSTVELHRMMALNKLNPPKEQGELFRDNVKEFIRIINDEFFNMNIKNYLRALIRTRIVANTYRKWGNRYWQLKFSPKYKFFWTQKDYLKCCDEKFDIIDKYFDKKVTEEVEKTANRLEIKFPPDIIAPSKS